MITAGERPRNLTTPALSHRNRNVLRAEFAYHREFEMAQTPVDFLLRRTRLGLFRPDLLRDPPALLR